MNRLLEYYIKNRKEKSEEYEEDMCEFIVLQPILERSVRSERILKGIDEDKLITFSNENLEGIYFICFRKKQIKIFYFCNLKRII